MNDIKDITEKVGDFEILTDTAVIPFEGTVIDDGTKIIVSGRLEYELSRQLNFLKQYRIIGVIDGIGVSLMNSYILCSYKSCESGFSVTIKVEASEIIIGRKIKDDGAITAATMELPEIYWFFSERQFADIHSFSKENPYMLKYCFPDDFTVKDDVGTLTISRALRHSFGRERVEYVSVPTLSFEFDSPVSLKTAREKIAEARNLFLYFADGYLPFHDIELSDAETSKEYPPSCCDFKMVFNSEDTYKAVDEPFFVTSAIVKNDIQTIWDKWGELYSHKFISALYYEIIRSRSTWVNEFLNLVQAIDLYENTYRETEARSLADAKIAKRKFLPLTFFVKDAILQLNGALKIGADSIDEISENINQARNYFTHYNDAEYREPSFPEIFAMSRVLRLILLGLIYKQLGIPDEAIEDAKKSRVYSVFDRDISVILRKEVENVDYTDYL